MGKKPGSGSGNNPDHISESLKNIILKFVDVDQGWKKFGFEPGSATPHKVFQWYLLKMAAGEFLLVSNSYETNRTRAF
jgi:hypothetical protein